MFKPKITAAVLVWVCLTGAVFASADSLLIIREVVSVSGGHDVFRADDGSSFYVSWNIGEPITEEFGSGSEFSPADASKKRLTQGFEQLEGGENIFILDPMARPQDYLSNEEAKQAGFVLLARPNPVRALLYIRIDELTPGDRYTLQIHSPSGKCLVSSQHVAGIYQVNMEGVAPGMYVLSAVSRSTGKIVTTKIIKAL